jgi:hypothetical protein
MAQANHLPNAIRVLITDARPRPSTNPVRVTYAEIARLAEHSSPFGSASPQTTHADDHAYRSRSVLTPLSTRLSAIVDKSELTVPGCLNIRQIEALLSSPGPDLTGAFQPVGDIMARGRP